MRPCGGSRVDWGRGSFGLAGEQSRTVGAGGRASEWRAGAPGCVRPGPAPVGMCVASVPRTRRGWGLRARPLGSPGAFGGAEWRARRGAPGCRSGGRPPLRNPVLMSPLVLSLSPLPRPAVFIPAAGPRAAGSASAAGAGGAEPSPRPDSPGGNGRHVGEKT